MIFVTVGTHEQPFDRLFEKLECMFVEGRLTEPVEVQSGYSRFSFKRCVAQPMLPFESLQEKMREASVVICHGGPATILQAQALGKVPVVVPRQERFGEHVNDHQVAFCRRLDSPEGQGGIVATYDISHLPSAIERARSLSGAAAVPRSSSEVENLCKRLVAYCDSL